MDENTVFEKKIEKQEEAQPKKPQQVVVEPSVEAKVSLSEKTPQINIPSSPPPPPPSSSIFSSFPLFTILKLLLGVFAVIVIIVLFTSFVLPQFRKATGGKVELKYWGLWEPEPVVRTIIDDFQKENPNIHVTYELQDVKQYRDRLTTRVLNGTGPDIFRFHNTWLPMFQAMLSPLPKDVITSEEFRKNFYPTAETDLTRNGAVYAIPLEIDTLSLFVNTDIVKAAGVDIPKTWDEFGNVARKLTVKDEQGNIKTSGAGLGTFDNITHAPDIISLLMLQNGVDMKNITIAQKNVVDALDYYTSFAKDSSSRVWDDTLDSSILAFTKGNLAMYFGYSWDVFAIRASNPNLQFQVYQVPHLPDRYTTVASYWAEGVSAKSKNQKEAFMFLKFLAKKETQQKLFSEASKSRPFGEPYSRIDLAESLRDNQYVYPFVAQGKSAKSSFFVADTYDNAINTQMNTYLGNSVRSILKDTSVQSAVDTLTAGAAQVLKQYGQ